MMDDDIKKQQMAAFSTVQPPRFGTEPGESQHQTAVRLYDVFHCHSGSSFPLIFCFLFKLLGFRYLFKDKPLLKRKRCSVGIIDIQKGKEVIGGTLCLSLSKRADRMSSPPEESVW